LKKTGEIVLLLGAEVVIKLVKSCQEPIESGIPVMGEIIAHPLSAGNCRIMRYNFYYPSDTYGYAGGV
jgi:hypothetical protein